VTIQPDGTAMSVQCPACSANPTVSVSGGPPSSTTGPNPYGYTFPGSPVTDATPISVTDTFQPAGEPTAVTLTDSAPLLGVAPTGISTQGPSYPDDVPDCSAYLDTNEAVCRNLMPGDYTLSLVRAGSVIPAQPVSVPAAATTQTDPRVPSLGAAAFSTAFQAGDQLRLSIGSRVLTKLTIDPFVFSDVEPLADPLSGSDGRITGTCTNGVPFTNGVSDMPTVCADGRIPAPNPLGDVALSLRDDIGVGGLDAVLGQLDDTSAGSTEVDLPSVAATSLGDEQEPQSVGNPFRDYAIVRHEDPVGLAAYEDAPSLAFGAGAPPASLASPAQVMVSLGPEGTTATSVVGNANQAGGIPFPTLAPGPYVDTNELLDGRGDAYSTSEPFFAQAYAAAGASTPGPAGATGAGVPGFSPVCTAKLRSVERSFALAHPSRSVAHTAEGKRHKRSKPTKAKSKKKKSTKHKKKGSNVPVVTCTKAPKG
jgi:hypothetical protein